MTELENILSKWENDIIGMSETQSVLLQNYLELTEMKYVIEQFGWIFDDEVNSNEKSSIRSSIKRDAGFTGYLQIITGVVRRNKSFAFEQILWRITLGNIYYKHTTQDILSQDPQTGKEIRNVGFLAICQGKQLSERIEKVCRGFGANTYSCPEDSAERMDMIDQLTSRINDMKQVMNKTQFRRCKALRTIGEKWDTWMVRIKKTKAVYHNMNLFSLDITKECLIGQCWIPDNDLPHVSKKLKKISGKARTNVPSFISKSETFIEPPTFHRTNKFTKGFQALINAYGISKYRELNPGLYTIITFPFLFAIMFGDFCHGVILFLFSTWMIKIEDKHVNRKSRNEIWNIFFGGRYVILLMGQFSMFTGIIYNSYFCKSLYGMTSYWKNHYNQSTIETNMFLTLDPAEDTNHPYVFGVDPTWALASNQIIFLNSIKMKMSIIVGVIQMIFGLLLSLVNNIYFKEYYLIPLQFLPRMIFLVFLFLWLSVLMVMKWFMYGPKQADYKRSPHCAPLILIFFIDMLLLSTTKPVDDGCDAYIFPSQPLVQNILLFVSLLCVPIMLFGPPIYLSRVYKKKREEALVLVQELRSRNDKIGEDYANARVKKYSANFGGLLLNEAIHTIEFVLSTISHTASYLRLWALSLAHEKLSDMLWHMVLVKLALRDTSLFGSLRIVVIFAVWAAFSISILVVMEGLSAFLHTLRLHWRWLAFPTF
ncbi:V-type proton ATPase 116 kDa subunit a-like isoform X1 [Aricia agestis]|uniref:V-type proton ATPase 116 kDa subunit a-like isoform X1 n=1 Tax=Aricia agestis TaxID=91739 RepID=UPI001C204215|nr:V-type proton ATPase 116 kDa subunit a-like isoform X1 [Aricia agestis]